MKAMNHPAIKLDHVTIELGGEVILKDVCLDVEHGETLVISVPSGAGKTVLLKTMAGIYKPPAASVGQRASAAEIVKLFRSHMEILKFLCSNSSLSVHGQQRPVFDTIKGEAAVRRVPKLNALP